MVKVNLGLKDACVSTFKKEGLHGFYKGMGPPLMNIPIINSIVFASFEFAKRNLINNPDPNQEITLPQSFLCGSFAGLINSIIVSPVELVKC